MKNAMHYDIIGDVHGRFDKLTLLMGRLGYREDGGGFIPPAGHCALFLGDLIDPKPGHVFPGGVVATLRAVKTMCDRGDALCLMGNHELNAIYFHNKGPDGNWLRVRGSNNVAMHQGTLDDFPDYHDTASDWHGVWLPWMKRLPFHFDSGGFRAVHATWHEGMADRIAGRNLECPEFFLAASNKHTEEGEALEVLLKGVEVALPDDVRFTDHTGASRGNIRARWWELPDSGIGYDQLVFPHNPAIPAAPVKAESFAQIPGYPIDAPPVFFGHYLKPGKSPLAPERHNVACLDYAAAKDGPLVAYRWKGEAEIKPGHYVTSHEH